MATEVNIDNATSKSRQPRTSWGPLRSRLAVYTCAAIILVLNLAFYSKGAPTLRLVELTICREYYQVHDPSVIDSKGFVEERLCKASPIQKELAWLFALDEILHFCCGKSGLSFICSRLTVRTFARPVGDSSPGLTCRSCGDKTGHDSEFQWSNTQLDLDSHRL